MLAKAERDINLRFLETTHLLIEIHSIKSVAAFARMLGLHPQLFSDYKVFKLKVSVLVLQKLIRHFSEVNLRYIISGEGVILRKAYPTDETAISAEEDYIQYFRKLKPKDFERIKVEYMILRSRCDAYENAFKLLSTKNQMRK